MFSNKTDDHKTATLLDTSIMALVAGCFVASIYPAYIIFAALMSIGGATGIGYYFATWSKFDRLWKNLNLAKGTSMPYLCGTEKTDHSKIYKFTLPAGLSSDDFERNKLAIEQFVGSDVDIRYTYKQLWIEVFDKSKKTVYEYQIEQCKGDVSFPIGYTRQGKLVYCDLSGGEPHLLIAGETGSGKSTVLRSIITNLILTKDVKLHLIDLKRGAEFQIFQKCSNVVSFCRNRAEARQTLEHLSEEIDRRYDLFFEKDCVDIKEYNRRFGGMDYQILIIDEFADLKDEKGSISLLEEIAAKARACGIHMIIATQRPDHITLNGRIKANVTTVLGLKTMNEANSRIILDKEGLENLRGHGHGIFKRGTSTEVQCPLLTTEKARELLRPTYVERALESKARANGEIADFSFLEVANNDNVAGL
jgi:S-DNA-T family DNA segregation ATPase FtsK/SpoIIIE